MFRTYSLRKCRHILHWSYNWLKRRRERLTPEKRDAIENTLRELEKAIFAKDKKQAAALAKEVEHEAHHHFKKSTFELAVEIVVAIVFALAIATVVRQMWFELYEIPTGSMRPTFREQDHLTVTKTAFGLNIPLETDHFMFNPDLVERGKVLIFSGDGLPMSDTDSTYFWVIPYKKRYIKRLIGKPGDALYFYGGMVYGIDKEGNPIEELLKDPWMQKTEHIPFITFEGEISSPQQNQIVFHHWNQPVGRLLYTPIGTHRGEIRLGKRWELERPFEQDAPKGKPNAYGDFFGMKNFAMARLLNKEEVQELTKFNTAEIGDAELYLSLRHNPTLTFPPPRLYKQGSRFGVQITAFESLIPLTKEHIEKIMDNLYTSRFVVKNGRARRYSADSESFQTGNPKFAGVPDGTYEFYHGKAEAVGFKGKTSALAPDHPLYDRSPEKIKELFNMGIEMLSEYDPYTLFQVYAPHRYAYFREGDLFVMGAPLIAKDDPALIDFQQREESRAAKATKQKPYLPFKDIGPPLKNGKLDKDFIRNFGITIPDKNYLVLGDNHAMSADSRVFGFVPEANIQGAPSLIIWPPGERWGWPPQSAYPLITMPRLIVWAIFLAVCMIWYGVHHYRITRRIFPEE